MAAGIAVNACCNRHSVGITARPAAKLTSEKMILSAQRTSRIFFQHRSPQSTTCLCKHTVRPHRPPARLRERRRLPRRQESVPLRAVSPDALNRALCDGSDWEEPAEGFNSISEALADLAEGKFVVVLDDERRENEGDLIMAAETMTTEAMAFMVEYTSGVICVPLEGR